MRGNKSKRLILAAALLVAAMFLSGCEEEVESKPAAAADPTIPILVVAAATGTTVGVGWLDVPGAVSYNVYRDTTPGVSPTAPFLIGTAPFGTPSLADPGPLANGTTYYYVVTSVDALAVESPASTEVSTTTIPVPPVVTPSPGNSQVTLTWPAVAGAASYNAYWSTASPVISLNNPTLGVISPHVVTGLTNGTPYFFTVTAMNGAGETALPSSEVASTPNPPPPPAPTAVSATPSGASINVTWTAAPTATGYRVYWSAVSPVDNTSPTNSGLVGGSPFNITGLLNGTQYFIVVYAENGAGQGPISTPESTATTAPPAPAGVALTPGTNQITVGWGAAAGATSYTVYWQLGPVVTTASASLPPTGGLSALHSTLTSTNTYYYRVEANNAAGPSALSAEFSAMPIPPPSTSLPAPVVVNPNVFPSTPDIFELDAANNDNTLANASTMPIGAPPQPRTVFPPGDVDWIGVTLPLAGVTYEFAARNLSTRGDTFMELRNSVGGLITSNDDYIGFDSRITYMAGAPNEQVYVVVFLSPTTLNPENPVQTYTLYAETFIDVDGDTYSPIYDCDDTGGGGAINPGAVQFQGDLTDFDCDGVIPPAVGTADGFEPDGTQGTAMPINLASGHTPEKALRPEIFHNLVGGGNMRTLDSLGADFDTVTFNVPAFGEYEASINNHFLGGSGVLGDLYNAAFVFQSSSVDGFGTLTITNATAAPATYYVQFSPVGPPTLEGTYWPYIMDLGVDLDGDGYYTKGGGLGWDCDDAALAVFPAALGEVINDGIDTNCDGNDDT